MIPLVKLDGPTIIFGGPYSNLQATEAVLARARRLGIPRDRIMCTGDLAAYCGEPVATIELVRDTGIYVVMGNCDEQLANNADGCGCGFPAGGLCERLSSVWFAYANTQVSTDIRRWLAQLPRRIDLNIGARRLAVIHGGVRELNRFVFASTPVTTKREEIDAAGADGIVAGHCGLPFSQIVDGRLWHNAGVVGMPANDGTPRVWYSQLTPDANGVRIEHCALEYDHAAAAAAMRRAGLPADYRDTLANGLWPSCDVLPARETQQQGLRLTPGSLLWAKPSRRRVRGKQPAAARWPSLPAMRRTAAPAVDSTAVACCAAPTQKSANACCGPSYIDAARDLYRDAALAPAANLCCTTNPVWQLPELNVPDKMLAMNYGCGTTVHPRDLGGSPSIVYVGVGGGLELLQFAYFSRRRGGVIGLDVVDEMLSACSKNLDLAEEINPWFKRSFIGLRKGDAFDLPIEDGVIDVAAQNCLFNIFQGDDLGRALSEMHRVLKPKGRLILSDPICSTEIPEALRRNERLRAMCLTGAISLDAYIERLAKVGFGIVEVRARRPYRVLAPGQFATKRPIVLESVEICAIKSPVAADGPDVFAGHTAIYFGVDGNFSDHSGLHLPSNQPTPISAKTAAKLVALSHQDIFVSEPTWFYAGATCC